MHRRRRVTCPTVTATIALFVALGAGSYAASPSTVVPPNGRVDGRTYGQWLAKSWQIKLAKSPGAAWSCRRVGDVQLIPSVSNLRTHTCSVPVGRAVYIDGWGTECSTIEKPPFHGRTPAELKACARRHVERNFSDSRWTIDGKAVLHPLSYVKASPAFRFHMPKNNILGLRKRSGRAAAYGAGLLLRGLAAGKHIVHKSVRFQGDRYEATLRILVGS